MTDTAPAMSKWRVAAVTRELGTSRRAAKTMATPIGTFTKKIHSQERVSTSTPPSSSPAALPPEAIAAQTESAFVRAEPSSKEVVITASAAGESSAPPRP